MNNDKKEEEAKRARLALEARIVAWISGEVTNGEAAELGARVAADPELAAFKRRIEATRDLVAEALAHEKEPLRISEEKRKALLEALGTQAPMTAKPSPMSLPVGSIPPKARRQRQWILALAACLVCGFFLSEFAFPHFGTFHAEMPVALAEKKAVVQPEEISVAQTAQGTRDGLVATDVNAVGDSKQTANVRHETWEEVTSSAPAPEAVVPPAGDLANTDAAPTAVRAGFALSPAAPGDLRVRKFEPLPVERAPNANPIGVTNAIAPSVARPGEPTVLSVAQQMLVRQAARRPEEGLVASSVREYNAANSPGFDRADTPERVTFSVQAPETSPSPAGDLANTDASLGGPSVEHPEETTVLSPFVVDSSEDKNRRPPPNTLAATRVRSDLNDVASAISVVTQQFLQDTSAVNSQDVLNYAPNTEVVPGLQGNFAGQAGKQQSRGAVMDSAANRQFLDDASAGGGLDAPTANTADNTHDSFQRGPNSILFGVGSPAGIINNTINGADLGQNAANIAEYKTWGGEGRSPAPDITAAQDTDGTPLAQINSRVAAKVAPSNEVRSGLGDETLASKEPVSTFSMHVSDASFELAKAALDEGRIPDPAGIRPEEFYNAFDYGDPEPAMSEKVSCRIEQAADPARQQRNLIRIALRVPSTGRDRIQPLRLTVLLDTSGSMEREDRAAAVKSAITVLVSLLGPADQVTLVGFARQPHVLAQQIPGNKAGIILDLATHTPAEGGTNLEEALDVGAQQAVAQFEPSAQNRVVLITDGATNLGDAEPSALALKVDALRQAGISFDACGVGTGGVDDEILETLTRKGSGRYYVLGGSEDADAGFARQLAGAFRPAAVNVKVQVRFNPARVGAYRLVGFAHHRLATEDFRNDAVAAAALARGEAAVAMYEVEPLTQGDGELGEVYVRFRDTATDTMVERSWTLRYDPAAPALDRASPSMQLAGVAMLLAEKLQGGAEGAAVRLSQLVPEMTALRSRYPNVKRVGDLGRMFEETRRLYPE